MKLTKTTKTLLTLYTLALLLILQCNATVSPDAILEKVKKGESVHVIKRVMTPEFPPMIDMVIMQDQTGSFIDDIDLMQGSEPDCSDGLGADLYTALDVETDFFRFGVGGFMDFFQDGKSWGSFGDVPYEKLKNLTESKIEYLEGICDLVATGGNDTPESQFHALVQSATDFNWSEDERVFRVLVLITDAPPHTPESTPDYPGPSEVETIMQLNDQNIHVIILEAPGAFGYETLAEETGGAIGSIAEDSADIIETLLEALGELTADLIPVTSDCDPRLTVTFDPPRINDAQMSSKYIFVETISVKDHFYLNKDEKLKCTVNFILEEDGPSIGEELIFILPEEHKEHKKHNKHRRRSHYEDECR